MKSRWLQLSALLFGVLAAGCGRPGAPSDNGAYPRVWRDLTRQDTPRIEHIDTAYVTFESEASHALLGEGWRDEEQGKRLLISEGNVVWAASIVAHMRLVVAHPRDRVLTLELLPHAFDEAVVPDPPMQEVGVLWNGTRLGVCWFDPKEGYALKTFRLELPANAQKPGVNEVTFLSKYAVSDQEMTKTGEPDRFAFGMRSVRLMDAGDGAPVLRTAAAFGDGAIVQQADTRLVLPMRLPAERKLLFEIGGVEAQGEATTVGVTLRRDSLNGPVVTEILAPTPAGRVRGPIVFDLSACADTPIELLLDAAHAGRDAAVVWQAPRILTDAAPDDTVREAPQTPGFANVVIIVPDALRADTVGCYGYRHDTTPSIDALARTGCVFERMYAPVPYTYSSTWSLFTSLYPFQHGAHGRSKVPGAPTLSAVLQDAGVATGMVTANPVVSARSGHGRGFDEVLEAFEPLDEQPQGDPSLATNAALDFMRRHARERFFLYVHFRQPHGPYLAPDGYLETITCDPAKHLVTPGQDWRHVTVINRVLLSRERRLELKTRYDENVRAVDAEIGRLVAALSEMGLDESTCVVVTSDHGEGFGEHDNVYTHGLTVYENLCHVPLVLQGEGLQDLLPARVRGLVSTVDLFPTVCGLMDVPTPASACGESVLAKAGRAHHGVGAFAKGAWMNQGAFDPEMNHWGEAYWWNDYKLIRDNSHSRIEVYDLRADPREQGNLAPAFPVLEDCLTAEAAVWKAKRAAQVEFEAVDSTTEMNEKDHELIQALGYL